MHDIVKYTLEHAMGVLLVLWIALIAVIGLLASGLLFVLYRKKDKGIKSSGTSWRQTDYYNRFLAQLSQAQRTRFSTFGEAEQFKAYMDWSLKEGSMHVEQKGAYEEA